MNAAESQRWSPIYLSVEMLHRGGTEEDEETDPERGSLKGDRFVGFILRLLPRHRT